MMPYATYTEYIQTSFPNSDNSNTNIRLTLGPGVEAIQGLGYRLVDALDHPLSSPAERLRVVLAVKLIVTAAMTQHSKVDADLHVDREELVPLLVSLAAQVMGASNGVPA